MNDALPESAAPVRRSSGQALAIAFGTTVLIWAIGYVTHMPHVGAPAWLVFLLLVLAIVAGGWVIGRYTNRGWAGMTGIAAGAAAINLLVVLAVVSDSAMEEGDATIWMSIPGFFAAIWAIFAIGFFIARRWSPQDDSRPAINWTFHFALAVVIATAFLLVAGGLVTGYRAGLSVPDWPNSFGMNMFLYPLSKMTGGIYYEHAHRLYGTLVGLGTVLLAIHLWRSDERTWLKWLVVIAVIAVVVQGAMGGFRVTLAEMRAEGIEVSSLSDETPVSVTLAVAHGVFGQLFLGLLVMIALACTTTWRQASSIRHPGTSTDRPLAVTLLAVLVAQLLLGAMTRQLLDEYLSMLLLHIAFAGAVTIVAMAAGLRAWGLYENVTVIRRTGVAVLVLLGGQLVAGLAALIAVGYFSSELEPTSADALITTLHQAIGAALLAVAVAHVAWTRRLLEPDEQPAPATQAEPAT